MNERIKLFVDSSADPKSKVGVGAFIMVHENQPTIDLEALQVMVQRFEDTSSTKLELQTLLWALGEISTAHKTIVVYTDSQNTVGLLDRRAMLEQNDFLTHKGKPLINNELYRSFYHVTDHVSCQFIKVKGHSASQYKNDDDRVFAHVDRAARKALKELVC